MAETAAKLCCAILKSTHTYVMHGLVQHSSGYFDVMREKTFDSG